MKTIKILILEDDIETLSLLTQSISSFQKRLNNFDLALTILAEYTQVEDYLNSADKNIFDIILLDRDCKACGSFHCLDFDKYSVDKIIGISSVPPYNDQLREKGVTRIVHKDFQAMDGFISGVETYLTEMIEASEE